MKKVLKFNIILWHLPSGSTITLYFDHQRHTGNIMLTLSSCVRDASKQYAGQYCTVSGFPDFNILNFFSDFNIPIFFRQFYDAEHCFLH